MSHYRSAVRLAFCSLATLGAVALVSCGTTSDPVDSEPGSGGGGNEVTPRFAGHIPNRVLIGINAPREGSGNAPDYPEAETLLAGARGGYARREFRDAAGPWYTDALFDAMVRPADAHVPRQLPIISFKANDASGKLDWQGVVDGKYDSLLTTWRNKAKARRVINGGNGFPVLAGLHHEPSGDGSFALWGKMQLYLVNWFSGWSTGKYVAADDVSDIMAWTTIMNGFKWGPNQYNGGDIAAAYPPELIAAMRRSGGPMMADFYDPEHKSFMRDAAGNRQEALII